MRRPIGEMLVQPIPEQILHFVRQSQQYVARPSGACSRGFFEAERFPEVEFVSEPYLPALIVEGGKLAGQLTIRDVTRRETFTIQPGTCARPAIDCDVIANGSVRRTDYGVDRWVLAVSDNVRFTLRLRVYGDTE